MGKYLVQMVYGNIDNEELFHSEQIAMESVRKTVESDVGEPVKLGIEVTMTKVFTTALTWGGTVVAFMTRDLDTMMLVTTPIDFTDYDDPELAIGRDDDNA